MTVRYLISLLTLVASALAAEESAGFRFCAYNVKNWLLMDRTYGNPDAALKPKSEKEKSEVMNALTQIKMDVLGLCEVGTDADVKEIQQRLEKAGMPLPHMERCQGRDGTRTLGLLSRYPILERRSHSDLPYKIDNVDFGVQRGFLHAVLEPQAGFRVHLMGVHLKSKRPIPEADQELMRRHEFFLLRKVVDETLAAEPGAKIMVYGDFNEHRGEPGMVNFLGNRSEPAKLLTDVRIKDSNGELWTHFWDTMDTYSRMDYFVVSAGLKPYIEAKSSYIYSSKEVLTGSDHRPIVLQVSFLDPKARAKVRR